MVVITLITSLEFLRINTLISGEILSLFGYGRFIRVSLKYLLLKLFSFNIYHMILFFLFHPYHYRL
jgi:hypothetical protein